MKLRIGLTRLRLDSGDFIGVIPIVYESSGKNLENDLDSEQADKSILEWINLTQRAHA